MLGLAGTAQYSCHLRRGTPAGAALCGKLLLCGNGFAGRMGGGPLGTSIAMYAVAAAFGLSVDIYCWETGSEVDSARHGTADSTLLCLVAHSVPQDRSTMNL